MYTNPSGNSSNQGVPSKAVVPTLAMPSGKVMEARLLQPVKAQSSISVTLSGMTMEVMPVL
jgi:hypothetical protein